MLDPYNLYFTTDGGRAIVVEAHRELDFRDPHSMRLILALCTCPTVGVDHMDYTSDGRFALASCEFAGRMEVIDLRTERAVRSIELCTGSRPQDVKISPDGRTFYAADMMSGGVWLVDAHTWRKIRFEPTGAGAPRALSLARLPSSPRLQIAARARSPGSPSAPSGPSERGESWAAARRTWAAYRPTAECSGSPDATTPRSTRPRSDPR